MSVLGSASMTLAFWAEAVGSPPECCARTDVSNTAHVLSLTAMHGKAEECWGIQDAFTHRDPLRKHCAYVHVRNARINVHPNGLPVLDKYLSEQHARDLACFDERVGHKVAVGSVRAAPARAETFLLGGSLLYENVARPGHLCFDSAT